MCYVLGFIHQALCYFCLFGNHTSGYPKFHIPMISLYSRVKYENLGCRKVIGSYCKVIIRFALLDEQIIAGSDGFKFAGISSFCKTD